MTLLPLENHRIVSMISGNLDVNLKYLTNKFGTEFKIVENGIKISGENEELSYRILETVHKLVEFEKDHNYDIDIAYIAHICKQHKEYELFNLKEQVVAHSFDGKSIYPKTIGQKKYIDLIKNNDITFGIGPAGTGKTYLAVAYASQMLKNKMYDRIILTRPAVEAGESLGFLPGDLKDKVDPYLRPIYDVLFEIFGYESYQKLIEKNIIEIAPLAYMRGRTLEKSVIVLDEAQNTTVEQMKMFITRLGFSSKMIITGDNTQTDLSKKQTSGLMHARKILFKTDGIGFCDLNKIDVVRHPLVRRVIEAYEKDFKEKNNKQ